MSNLSETSTYEAGIYQLETTDPVVGGPSGISNQQAKQLANRTKYLKDHVDALETSTSTTAPQFDNDTSPATTAFVQRALGNLRSVAGISTTATLTAAHVGQLVQCSSSGPYSVTLPLVASIPDGAVITIASSASGTVTIARQGSDVIYPNFGSSVTSIALGNGDTASFVRISGGWALFGGSASLKYTADFGGSLGANGWQKLPSGLIMQWGGVTTNTSADTLVTFPVAFPTASCSIVGSVGSGTLHITFVGNGQSATGFYCNAISAGGRNASSCSWMAIGY